MNKHKYFVLDILRGLSALFVVFYHYFVFFFTQPELSAALLAIEPLYLPDPFYMGFLESLPFNIGYLGLGFFFSITGFLIQPSLERYATLKAFLVHKIFRLWPTYVVCFGTSLLFVVLFCYLLNHPFPYSFTHVLSYFFWVRDIFFYGYPYIDGSVWTLEIQIKFYLLAGLIWALGGKNNFLEKISLITIVLGLVTYGFYIHEYEEEHSWFYLILIARSNLKFYIFILLGACVYSYYKQRISWVKAVGLCTLLMAYFLSPLFHSYQFQTTASYVIGFGIFTFLILMYGETMKEKGLIEKSFKWLSDISYPLYAGHVLPGYTMMFFMIENGLSVFYGAFAGIVYSLFMATVVHKNVEAFFLHINKKALSYTKEKQHSTMP